MKKKLKQAAVAAAFVAAFTAAGPVASAQEKVEHLDTVVITVSRAGEMTPVTFTSVPKEELERANPMNSLPMTLSLQPSVISMSEGGTGLGYSKMTVRGIKGSQINVTFNGITLNDAESQEVFWVNIPALSSILSDVQLQRGLGTSASGAGAFGASVNMGTKLIPVRAFAKAEVGRGSWNTLMTSVAAGTGLLPGGLFADAAYSKAFTDGYIRNAKADVQSAFGAVGLVRKRDVIRFTWLFGDQHTGITWNGLPLSKWETGEYRYNSAGEYYDSFGNVRYYDNETDNYTQHHLQLNWTHGFSSVLTWSTTVNRTKGDGYYDQLKASKKFSKYGLSPVTVGGVEYSKADFNILKYMDNTLWALNSDLKYTGEKIDATAGINLSHYSGDHFGNVRWISVLGEQDLDPWYTNNGTKKEGSIYARAEFRPLGWLTAYADLQYRLVNLVMTGEDDDNVDISYRNTWGFFNPRAGATAVFGAHKAYLSAAMGHREPGRTDLKENIKDGAWREVRPEKMIDIEAGYQYSGDRVTAGANLYLMEYYDMLLETGRISAVGNAIKENIDRGWRRGVELSAAWTPSRAIRVDGNLTLSINQIADYTAYYEDWDAGGYTENHIGKTTMLLSPSVIGMGRIEFTPFTARKSVHEGVRHTPVFTLSGKYAGAQYWDNTQSPERRIPAYFVADFSARESFSLKDNVLTFSLFINNILGARYYADVWVYRAWDGTAWYQEEGLTPQAPRNLMFKITYSF